MALRRPTTRVIVSDADPALCGALAHLVGVAFRTPVTASSMSSRVRVEVLGEYQLNSPLMATAMGESFAADVVTDLTQVDAVSSVVTMSGVSQVTAERAFIQTTGAPIVCLSRLTAGTARWALSLASVACSDDEAFAAHAVGNYSIFEIADLCQTFATIVAKEFAG